MKKGINGSIISKVLLVVYFIYTIIINYPPSKRIIKSYKVFYSFFSESPYEEDNNQENEETQENNLEDSLNLNIQHKLTNTIN